MQAPLTTHSLLRLGVAAIWMAFAADASAQSLKITGLTHSGNQNTITDHVRWNISPKEQR